MAASTASYQSPLSTLSRASRSRRPSPTNLSPDYPAPTTTTKTTNPNLSNRATIGLDDDSDDDDAAVPELSALARMILDESPVKLAETAQPVKSSIQPTSTAIPSSSYAPFPRKQLTWVKSSEIRKEREEPIGRGAENTSIDSSPNYQTAPDFATPAARARVRRPFTGGYTSNSTGSSGSSTDPNVDEGENKEIGDPPIDQGSVIRPTTATITQSAMRWKRTGRGLIPGLAGRPRRGGIRRESSDQEEKIEDNIVDRSFAETAKEENEGSMGSPVEKGKLSLYETDEVPLAPGSPQYNYNRISMPGSIRAKRSLEKFDQELDRIENKAIDIKGPTLEERKRPRSFSSISRRQSPYGQDTGDHIKPDLVGHSSRQPKDNKENMPPQRFKRPSPIVGKVTETAQDVALAESPVREPPKFASLAPTLPSESPQRNALTSRASNAPLRPAPPPPPPKMSIMNAATAPAGAATAGNRAAGQRQRRPQVVINGRVYQRLDAIGKGGSCKVYKVMAENSRVFAMKKVTFNEEHGQAAILGYKGEIELLKKLEKVDRVVRLFDWEINDQRGALTLLMECGETDLAKLLQAHYSADEAQLDISFTRHYWREMLLCVQAVHALNIIHSDLKPANFLVVQGRLKLIDFGIANAIQDDTVNIHRECQVGTVNYMSPEALTDVNAQSGRAMQSIGGGRLMKLGAPSDVWSLGIILYQMIYGKPPFAHLSNSFQRLNAILDPKFEIHYPSTGIGDAYVPKSAMYTIQDCLERDKNERATIAELLSDSDPFLHPDRVKDSMVEISEDTIMRLLENAAEQVDANGMPSKEIFRMWANDVYGKLKKGNRLASKRERANVRRS